RCKAVCISKSLLITTLKTSLADLQAELIVSAHVSNTSDTFLPCLGSFRISSVPRLKNRSLECQEVAGRSARALQRLEAPFEILCGKFHIPFRRCPDVPV